MSKEIKNIGVSIRQKLLFIAKKSGRDYNSLLNQFFQERFLYKLSISPYTNNFILKGALLLLSYNIERTRPTKDIDFLGKSVNNDIVEIKKIISKICSIKTSDEIEFITAEIKAERIKEDAQYGGIRMHIPYKLHTIKGAIQIDIGFGDKIIGGPIKAEFPVLLDFPSPLINVYSIETALAEKFEAIVKLNFQSSRLKDFFDVIHIASHYNFKSDSLASALNETFTARKTNIDDRKTVFSDEFKFDKKKESQWNAFLTKNKITFDKSFPEVIAMIEQFINPVFNYKSHNWNSEEWKWE